MKERKRERKKKDVPEKWWTRIVNVYVLHSKVKTMRQVLK